MLQIENDTPYPADRAVLIDGDGSKIWVVVVKATFRIEEDGACSVDPQQEPVTKVPRYAGQPGMSTLLRESELVVHHPGTTITLNASAYAPEGGRAYAVIAGFEVGTMRKYLRVTGDRRWARTSGTIGQTEAVAFPVMPLTWERAFGGRCTLADGTVQQDDRNPAGTGLAASPAQLENVPLPNVEYAQDLVLDARSRPVPAGFSAVPGSWSPRRELAGTFDDQWLSSRSPLWPADYDARYHLSAPADQVSPDPLRGGERVVLKNLTKRGVLKFRLPRVYFTFDTFLRASGRRSHPAQLDRVIIEPDSERLLMVWRTTVRCGADARAVEATVIGNKRVLR